MAAVATRFGTIPLVLWWLGLAGVAAAAPICPGGRFLVQGEELIAGQNFPSPDAVVMTAELVSIASGCAPVTARLTATSRGTILRATWPECREPRRKLVLRAEINPTCNTMTGTLIGRRLKLRRRFVATLSECTARALDAAPGKEGCDGASGEGCELDCDPLPSPPSKTPSAPPKTSPSTTPPSTGDTLPASRPMSGAGLDSPSGFGLGGAEPSFENDGALYEVPNDGETLESEEQPDLFGDDLRKASGYPLKDVAGVGFPEAGIDLPRPDRPGGSARRRHQSEGVREAVALAKPANDSYSRGPAPAASTEATLVKRSGGEARGNAKETLKLTFENGKLTAEIIDAPVRRVLEEVARLTGTEAQGLEATGNETVSVSFAGLSFQEAIERLLRTKSFVLVTASADRRSHATRIVILGAGRASGPSDPGVPAPPVPAVAVQTPAQVLAGGDEMGERPELDALITMALAPEDAPGRMRAMGDLIALARSDEAARAALAYVDHARGAGDVHGTTHRRRLPLSRDGIAFNRE